MSRTGAFAALDGLRTWNEAAASDVAIASAVAAAAGDGPAAAALELLGDSEHVVVTGAGSSYYLAQAAAAAARELTRRPFYAAPLSELVLRPEATLVGSPSARAPVIVISRSGSTSEAIAVVEAVRGRGHGTIAVTCRAESPLATLADVTLLSPDGDEAAIVMTRSFASMLALLIRLVGRMAGGQGERSASDLDHAADAWPGVLDAARTALRLGETSWSRVVILGGGAAYGIASEWGLKLLETSQVPISVYEPLEFRHGPISVCEPGVLVVGLVGGAGAAEEARVLDEARSLGAATWLVTDGTASPDGGEASVVAPGLAPVARLPLLLLPGQALALRLALTRGCNPDAPRHLDQVVILSPA